MGDWLAARDCSGLFSQILGQIDFEGLRKNKDATWRIGMVVVLRTRSVLAPSCVFRLSLGNVYRRADAGEGEKLTGSILDAIAGDRGFVGSVKEAQGNFH